MLFLIKDPDQAENNEEEGVMMDADQPDCGEGKENDQPSYGKKDGIMKVRYEI